MSTHRDKLFSPTSLAGLTLRNRVIKTATFEGRTPNGVPGDELVEFHRQVAAGGTALTTVAYCGVSPDSRTFPDQMHMHDGIFSQLKRLTDTVHAAGGAVSGQMAHCGFFSRMPSTRYPRPLGPSFVLNAYGFMNGIPFGGAMNAKELDEVVADYASAAAFMKRAGFDAAEIHMGHGYLLSQFISPATNRRTDDYGGSLRNRMRLPLRILESVRKAVGDDFPLLAKINLSDGFKGGLGLDEAVEVARMLEQGGINCIVMSGGFTSRSPMYLFRGGNPLQDMIAAEKSLFMKVGLKMFGSKIFREMPYEEMYFLDKARRVRDAVQVPLAYLGGVSSLESMEKAMAEGFDFVTMGRALLNDPDMINRLQKDAEHYRNRCNHCNLCVPMMDRPGGIRCVLND